MKTENNYEQKTERFLIGVMFLSACLYARPMDLYSPNLETNQIKNTRTLFVPAGSNHLLSRNCVVTSSTHEPDFGELAYITDGNKDAAPDDTANMVKLGPGIQWVQLDLGSTQHVYGVCIWRHHYLPTIYRDVIVQLANDNSFTNGVITVFNNDHDNSSGLGIGCDKEYIECNMGWYIPVNNGAPARYIRVYSNGRYLERGMLDAANYYTEIEVYGGSPTKQELIPLTIEIPRPQFL